MVMWHWWGRVSGRLYVCEMPYRWFAIAATTTAVVVAATTTASTNSSMVITMLEMSTIWWSTS